MVITGEIKDNLIKMLLSSDSDNHNLAFEILKSNDWEWNDETTDNFIYILKIILSKSFP